jgi:hypothetical protein
LASIGRRIEALERMYSAGSGNLQRFSVWLTHTA